MIKSQIIQRIKRINIEILENTVLRISNKVGTIQFSLNNNPKQLYNTCLKYISSLLNGWYIRLRFEGFGYKFKFFKQKLRVYLGHSSNIDVFLPNGVIGFKDKRRKQHIVLYSIDIQLLKNTVLKLKNLRPLNCYKYIGVLYVNQKEKQKIKPGKQQYK